MMATKGWEQHALFDGILITAATKTVSSELLNQLSPNGRLVLPLGTPGESQQLCVINKTSDNIEKTYHDNIVFVPLLPGKKI